MVSVCDPSMMCGMMRVIPSSLPAPPLRAWLSGHVNENNETHEVESMVRGRRAMALTSTWSLEHCLTEPVARNLAVGRRARRRRGWKGALQRLFFFTAVRISGRGRHGLLPSVLFLISSLGHRMRDLRVADASREWSDGL